MGKLTHPITSEVVAEAHSTRKGERFRATKHGLEKLQTIELRSGKSHRMDELPYARITSLSYEERVLTKGNRFFWIIGIAVLLAFLGIPALSTLMSILNQHFQVSRIMGLSSSTALPDIAGVTIGVYLIATKLPRKTKEGWWQIKSQDLTPQEQYDWRVAANAKGAEQLVKAVKEGISKAYMPSTASKP